MSGHSKWATIKHKKAATDAKRGRAFTRLIKEIAIAARAGGGDADTNPRLRTAILAAKAENMPADNIKRAVQRGTGELPGTVYEEFSLEGYGPGGVALLLDVTTDNRNRTVSEVRHLMSKNHGNMGEAGCVAWMFKKRGTISVPKSAIGEDDLMALVLDAGADDLRDDGSTWEVLTPPEAYEAVLKAVQDAKLPTDNAEVAMVPQNYVKLEGKDAEQMIKLLEAVDESDDITHVYSNFDMDEQQLASAS
ncbi:MAG: YebC/PmpR family DNA-binding transcriptional regulator [Terriglobales bacterium]